MASVESDEIRRKRDDPATVPATDVPLHSLVLVHSPGDQARKDFETIASKIRKYDSRLEVHIATNRIRNREINRQIVSTPTLIFSPVEITKFAPVRGKIYMGGAVDKLKQYEAFSQHNISTPKTGLLSRETVYSSKDWGERVVLKPLAAAFQSAGKRIYLISTKRLNHDIHIRKEPVPQLMKSYLRAPGGRRADMFDHYDLPGGVVVQQFVNTGPELEYHRVLALFGEPLYVMRTTLVEPITLDFSAHVNETIPIANQSYGGGKKHHTFVDPPGFRALALACFRAFPDRALQAIDVLRDHDTDRLFVLEVNAGGNTWHFSSKLIAARVPDRSKLNRLVAAKIRQFGAFDVAARVLADWTRLEAA